MDREGGPCTEAARRKTQVIVSDVASDTQWDKYWMAHGRVDARSKEHAGPPRRLASNGLVLRRLRGLLARAAHPN